MAGSVVNKKFEDEYAKKLEKYFTMYFPIEYALCNGYVLPVKFPNFRDQIRRIEIRPDDVWVCIFHGKVSCTSLT